MMRLRREGSATPLYRQIASRLQYEIITGTREPGTRLPSLRDAAELWNVNLHTVRRAYKELEAAGLVEMERPAGTRVTAPSIGPQTGDAALPEFLDAVVHEAAERFSLTRRELATRLLASRPGSATATATIGSVVECSRTLSRMLTDELKHHLRIELEAWDLRESADLPSGPVLGTWFHHSELTERLRGRPGDLHLIRIRPSEALLTEIHELMATGQLWSLILLDRQRASAHNLAIDFQSRLGARLPIETRIPMNPANGLPVREDGVLIVATPQTWDELSDEARQRGDVRLLRYEIYEEDLQRTAEVFGSTVRT